MKNTISAHYRGFFLSRCCNGSWRIERGDECFGFEATLRAAKDYIDAIS